MSQAIIDFCERLKTTLLGVEERLGNARESFSSGADRVEDEAKKHIDEASEQLRAFKAEAAKMAEKVRAELPEGAGAAQEKLKEFGLEAQVALRHAAVFLAENAAKGAETAAAALKKGAENLRRETAVTNPSDESERAPPSS